ncbi:uncharacterized protein M6B38_110575 [Iris pallida]|uniref:Reverse transcriptase domain-containing protein n=1 Tax=Iris pallida TaxID=29817 RepID=A0AAX6DZW5_IRIPA|nr:uncharacterized protein M6B38_110575 [Iris pallida]
MWFTNYFKNYIISFKDVYGQLISPLQNAFVPGRQISDNAVIAREIFHAMSSFPRNKNSFALKIDMSKAYDRLSWKLHQGRTARDGYTRAHKQLNHGIHLVGLVLSLSEWFSRRPLQTQKRNPTRLSSLPLHLHSSY